MGDAFYDTTVLANQITEAYEQYSYYALRDELYFDACASIKPVAQSHPGNTVQFNIYQDLAPEVDPLSETADVVAVSIGDNTVNVALNEYGNAAITSAKARGLSFLPVNEDVANVVGYNGGISFDSLARNVLVNGTNVYFGNGGAGPRNTLNATNLLRATDVRRRVANLSSDNVQTVMNGMYKGFMAPEVAVDLTEETGAASWRDPHTYSQPEQIWNGEIGAFQRVSWIEAPRLSANNLELVQGGPGGFVNGGAAGGAVASFDVFPVLILGNQALAKTWSSLVSGPMPNVVLGEVTDKLRRFVPVGWYWLGGFGRFREQAIRRIEVTTSMVK